jgi:hypothetical protein
MFKHEPSPPDPAVQHQLDALAAPLGLPDGSSSDDEPAFDVYPALVELARVYNAPTPLVWRRLRRGERLFATLRTDGLIELPDGQLFDDPSDAAQSAAGVDGEIDGWYSWRLGDGLTLADAADGLNLP